MATTISGTNGVDKVDQTTMDAGVAVSLNASGSAPMYACRAWAIFAGGGTPTLSNSGNVTTITDLGTGLYRMNYAVPMPVAAYGVAVAGKNVNDSGNNNTVIGPYNYLTTSISLKCVTMGNTNVDPALANFAVFA